MKVLPEAIRKAKEKQQDNEDLTLCLNNLICPNCACNLQTGTFPSFSYTCGECNFRFTSADEAQLEKRLERNG